MKRIRDRAVWITGLGAVTAAGCGTERLGRALRGARSCVRPFASLGGVPAGVAGEFTAGPECRHLDRSAAMFLTSAEEAWLSSRLESPDPERCAVIEGGSLGPMAELLAAQRARSSRAPGPVGRPLDLVRFMPGAGGVAFAGARGLRGPVLQLSAGSASAACAIALAADRIVAGEVDVAVAGGSECPLQEDIVASFAAAGLAATDESIACRPFDRRRRRTVLGEGAGSLVLESPAHARSRGAAPIAILEGWGSAGESHDTVRPDPRGTVVRDAARRALGNRDPAALAWIKTHGTGTRLGDAAEYRGLVAAMDGALPRVPVTSLKPLLGHCLGASAAVEAVALMLVIRERFVPVSLGTEEVDGKFPDLRVATGQLECGPGPVLALAEGFGGRCVALLLAPPFPG
ncbi:MAG TPA: beta-ketoacyl synthase N-terminal-like domain-containing protein [Gemmatimonadota bacterium]|nr:beta-ketoacyl synthase N-terminal-like domain-containing protein [Gemmatimonadota bacterium]